MKYAILYLLIGILLSCGNNYDQNKISKKPIIISYHNQAKFKTYTKQNLDSLYPNLLDPKNAHKKVYKKVVKSWRSFHQQFPKFMKEKKFTWGVPDSTIRIVNKIYFNKNGHVEYYFFKIQNPSVPEEKKNEFEAVLQHFSEHTSIDLKREHKYAQCGKTVFANY
jgi:hypothetical protein